MSHKIPVYTHALRLGIKLYADGTSLQDLATVMLREAGLSQSNDRAAGLQKGFIGVAELAGDVGAMNRFYKAREIAAASREGA